MASEHLATAFLKEVADISRPLEAINLPQGQEVVGKSDFDLFPKIIAESFRQNDLLVFQHTTHSIARIALDNGFYDHSAFVKRFRKFTGTTPLQYRREQQATLKADRAIALPKVN